MTQLHVIDHSAQVAREWVRDLARLLDWDDEQRALRLLRATLHAVRDWLDVGEAADLGAQLPTLVRGFYYEAWQPARMPAAERSKRAFLARIGAAFEADPIAAPEEAVCDVFRLLNAHISPGEISDVRHRLPKAIRDLWPV